MKKNNTIIIVIGVIAFFGVLFYFTAGNKSSVPGNTSSDSHGHNNIAANVSASFLNDLVDKQIPAFSLADRDGKIYSPDSLKGKNVVLFFNEGLMCYPACWNQIVALSEDERFKNEDTAVLSVVVDPPQDWRQAIKKMP